MLRLFIENREIELTDEVQFAITKQFDNLTNPTSIINDWSKTVSIPFTHKNDAIFGYIYNVDKQIVQDNGNNVVAGIYFNPLKKLDMRLQWGNDVLMVGYAKMNNVKQIAGKGTYEITLFGQLGKIFQDLSKITFNANDENSDYIIDGSQYVDSTINKALVVSSWNSNGQSTYALSGSTITDIIGFAPNNSYYEEFDSKSFQSDTAEAKTFAEVLKTKWDNGNGGYVTGVEPDTAIPNGMLPRDIGEFRSYYQTPFIYWNKLWQIFQKKAESLTGYQWELDDTWFTSSNPYYSKLVYMLKPFNVKNGTSLENHYTKWGYDATQRSLGRSTTPNSPQVVRKFAMPRGESVVRNNKIEAFPLLPTYEDEYYDTIYPHYPTQVATFKCPDDFASITYRWHIPMYIETKVSGSHLRDNSGLIISMKMWGCDDNVSQANARVVQTNNFIIRHEGSNFTYRDYTPIDTGSSPSEGDNRYKLVFALNSNFAASASKCGAYCYFTIECSYTDDNPMTNGLGDAGYTWYRDSAYVDVNLASGAFRSGVNFTLNDLWNNDYNLFEQILNYCKMYRILIFTDDANKKLKFIRASKYFQTYNVLNWTNKLDMSKDFVITPITFENKYVIFNYDDNKSKLGEKYKESWGVNYGEKRLVTQYNFNDEKKNLFDKKITDSITNTDFSLSWTNLYDYNKISYSLPAEIFPYAKDKDSKPLGNFGAFYFHNGKRSFDTTAALRMRGVKISDDTTFQQSNDTYCYSQAQDGTSVSTYPALDIVYSDNEKLCLFNKPMENYTYAKNLSNSIGIYDMFWKIYIDERYNIQNKKVTCYLRLKPTDFMNFEYKNFVRINNVLYFVNKIYDYNVESKDSTKVDLITVQDLKSYYVDYYADYLTVSPSAVTLDGTSGTTNITIDAYQNAWNYKLYDGEGNVVSNPTEITVTKVNNTTLRITKNGNYSLNYFINIYTATHTENVRVTGARSPYIEFIPTSVVVTKNATTEFDIRVKTNLEDVNMIATNTIQWWNPKTSQWKTTAYQAASQVDGWGSPEEGDTYNEAHEDRDFTIHVKIVNPTSSSNIMFFEHMPVSQYYYVPYVAIDGTIATLNSEGTAVQNSDSVEYHGISAIRGYRVYSATPWTASLPQGVRSYGATSGDAGVTMVTFDWGSGTPNTSKSITFSNTGGDSCSLSCTYVTE